MLIPFFAIVPITETFCPLLASIGFRQLDTVISILYSKFVKTLKYSLLFLFMQMKSVFK